MARREITQFFDDLDGNVLSADEVQVVNFSLDNTDYRLDLSEANAAKVREAFAPYIAKAQKDTGSRGGRGRRRGSATAENREFNRKVRDWANRNGHEVAARGKIADNVIAAYKKAHNL